MGVVVDTNVALVAEGQSPQANSACRSECRQRLVEIVRNGGLLLDETGLIVQEYVKSLGHSGQPGVGRAFAKWAFDHQYAADSCTRIPITPCPSGWRRFDEFPDDEALGSFHADDQKFVAIARASGLQPEILNAVDSDWWTHRHALARHSVHVTFLCPEQFKDD